MGDTDIPAYRAAEVLEHLHARGDRQALMYAIYLCLRRGVVPPPWARELLCAGFHKVQAAKVRSWDDAFGKPYPKGAKLPALRAARRRYQVEQLIDRLRRAGTRGDLHTIAGRKLGLGRTKCVELEKMARDEIAELLAEAAKIEPRGWTQLPLPMELPETL